MLLLSSERMADIRSETFSISTADRNLFCTVYNFYEKRYNVEFLYQKIGMQILPDRWHYRKGHVAFSMQAIKMLWFD